MHLLTSYQRRRRGISLKISPLKSFLHKIRAAMSQEPVFKRRDCEAHCVGSKDVVTDANACLFFSLYFFLMVCLLEQITFKLHILFKVKLQAP